MTTEKNASSELKACPFCNVDMTHRAGSYKHPNNDCYLCAIVIFPPQYKEWNTRALVHAQEGTRYAAVEMWGRLMVARYLRYPNGLKIGENKSHAPDNDGEG